MGNMEKMNIEDMDKKMPFEVPEGYFEGFEEKMMNKIAAMEEEELREVKLELVRDLNAGSKGMTKWMRWATGVAAAVVVIVGVFAVMHLQNDLGVAGKEIVVAAAGGTDEEYYDQLNEELNSDEIEEALAQIEFGEY